MRVKYNRVSTHIQSGNRFEADTDKYDLILLDKISGTVPFKDRKFAKILIDYIQKGIVKEVVVEELSRLGRHTGDCITTLEWMDSKEVNVIVRNLGVQSRPNGKKNPIWSVLTSVISSLYALELENIKERTSVGRQIYVQRGGILGRKIGSTTSDRDFIDKPKSQKILEYIKKEWTIREIAKQVDASTKTVLKVKKVANKLNLV
ncbi:recombinase family protein [Flavobacterium sp.]|jgi:DNA invertase Pin-like site-specific DNA recombinase|uniref:recombinase family protein n=1 Tax=Flavobacterium sp. TaxID=239 RepID=UPI0037BE3CC5